MNAECWMAIPDYRGLYAVSDRGRVMSFHRKGRILRAGLFKDYYPTVTLNKHGQPRMFHVFRLVATAFLGPIPDGNEINHKDGIKTNSNLENLEYITPSENAKHAYRMGLRQPTAGEKHPNARMTNLTIKELRKAYANGASQSSLAEKYKLSKTHVSGIVTRRFWKNA